MLVGRSDLIKHGTGYLDATRMILFSDSSVMCGHAVQENLQRRVHDHNVANPRAGTAWWNARVKKRALICTSAIGDCELAPPPLYDLRVR